MPDDTLGRGHLVREDVALVEPSIAIGILEPRDAVRRVLGQVVSRWIVAGGIGHVEAAAIVEAGEHRVRDQRRPGDALDDDPRGVRERWPASAAPCGPGPTPAPGPGL